MREARLDSLFTRDEIKAIAKIGSRVQHENLWVLMECEHKELLHIQFS
jgi:hypothetical protein